MLLLLVTSRDKDMQVLNRNKKALAEDSLGLPLHCGSASNCRAESRADYPPHSRVQHPTVAYFQPKTLSLVSLLVRDDTSPLSHCHIAALLNPVTSFLHRQLLHLLHYLCMRNMVTIRSLSWLGTTKKLRVVARVRGPSAKVRASVLGLFCPSQLHSPPCLSQSGLVRAACSGGGGWGRRQ